MRRLLIAAVASVCLLGPGAAPGHAATVPQRVARDYSDNGRFDRKWTVRQLRRTLRALSPDNRQYSNFDDALRKEIKRAKRRAARKRRA